MNVNGTTMMSGSAGTSSAPSAQQTGSSDGKSSFETILTQCGQKLRKCDTAAADTQTGEETPQGLSELCAAMAAVIWPIPTASLTTETAQPSLEQGAELLSIPGAAQTLPLAVVPTAQIAQTLSASAPAAQSLAAVPMETGAPALTGMENQTAPLTQESVAEVKASVQTQTVQTAVAVSPKSGDADQTQQKAGDDSAKASYTASRTETPVFRDVKAVPVKVGDAPAIDTQSADFEQALTRQVTTALENGSERVKLSLTPASLGKIEIELTRSAQGVLQVTVHTATEKAAALLAEHSQSLGQLLQDYSQSSVQIHVQHQGEADSQNAFRQNGGQGGQQQQQQQQQSRRQTAGDDFLHQLRLGLVPLEQQAV